MKKEIMEWIKSIGIALVVAFVITQFVGGTRVYGDSMNPTLIDGEFLITRNNNKVSRGDIVIIQTNLEIDSEDLAQFNALGRLKAGKYKKLIKRVVAVEGDSLIINDGVVFLNDQQLDERYINGYETPGDITIERIPEGKVFVMGDNRGNSLDSRSSILGLVDVDDILGRAIMRVYPFTKLGIID